MSRSLPSLSICAANVNLMKRRRAKRPGRVVSPRVPGPSGPFAPSQNRLVIGLYIVERVNQACLRYLRSKLASMTGKQRIKQDKTLRRTTCLDIRGSLHTIIFNTSTRTNPLSSLPNCLSEEALFRGRHCYAPLTACCNVR